MASRRVSLRFLSLLTVATAAIFFLSHWSRPVVVYRHLAVGLSSSSSNNNNSINHRYSHENSNHNTLAARKTPEIRRPRGFLLDSVDCKIPDIDPFDPEVMDHIIRRGEVVCSGKPSITYIDGSFLRINRTVIDNFYDGDFKFCQYQNIYRGSRNSDFSFSYGELSPPFDDDVLVLPKDEFMRIYCYSRSNGRLSTNFHAVVTRKRDVEKRCNKKFVRHLKENKPKEVFNVQMIGVDSVSRLNFIRQMRQTREFLLKDLNAFEMSGYNKVEDNTFVNIVPMTVGKFVSEIGWNETMRKQAFDNYNFIWRNFSNAGYRTFYAEDAPKIAIFVYGKEGFHNPPADYYNRPLSLAMEIHRSVWNKNHHCIVDRLETTMLLNHITEFSRSFKKKPHFGFTFITRLTHDNIGLVNSADYAYVDFLKKYRSAGYLDNTILILYSDHGYRFGDTRNTYVGKVEERLPFLYLVFPDWFQEKYPKLAETLRTNSKRLTTPFDIYETLKDILHFDGVSRQASLKSRGISLFREIPKERNCEHAGILPHWCLCLEQKDVPSNSVMSVKVAEALVAQINDILSPAFHLCAKLSLKSVFQVVRMQSNEKILRFEDSFHDVINKTVVYGDRTDAPVIYQITISTQPGQALFEATLIFDPVRDLVRLAGQISRINAYRDQSRCVDNSLLKKFCLCL